MIDQGAWGITWGDTWGSSWGYDASGEIIQVEEFRIPRGHGSGSAAIRFGTDRTRPRKRYVEEDEALLMACVF